MTTCLRCLPISILSVFASALWPAAGVSGSVVVNSWSLGVGISDPGGGGPSASFNKVTLPFADQHSVSYSNSTSSASYNFSGQGADVLDLDVSASLTCEGNPPVYDSGASGSIIVTTDVPMLLSVDAVFSYNLAAGDRESRYEADVVRGTPHTYCFRGGGGAQTVFGDPPIGTLTAHGDSILLPANTIYGINYNFELFSYSGSPTLLSYATGSAHFHLAPAPVPEPATLLLLACAAPFIARRRASQRRIAS